MPAIRYRYWESFGIGMWLRENAKTRYPVRDKPTTLLRQRDQGHPSQILPGHLAQTKMSEAACTDSIVIGSLLIVHSHERYN